MRLAHPEVLIDISGLQVLTGIDVVGDTLGVLTTHRMLETTQLRAVCPLLTDLAPFIALLAVRFRGTRGGFLVHADPSAKWSMAVATLRTAIELASSAGVRRLSAEEFFLRMLVTALAPDEILWRVAFPVLAPEPVWR